MRGLLQVLVLLCAGVAPYQCAREPDFEERRLETPAEALFGLAQQFKAGGDTPAWRKTLEYLVAHYPSSRFAKLAQHELEGSRPGSVASAAPSSSGAKAAQ